MIINKEWQDKRIFSFRRKHKRFWAIVLFHRTYHIFWNNQTAEKHSLKLAVKGALDCYFLQHSEGLLEAMRKLERVYNLN